MLVFRSFAIGLSAACFALLVMRPSVVVVREPLEAATIELPPSLHRTEPPPQMPTIVDAAPGITPTQLALSIRLAAGEHITSVDDVAVTSELSAGIVLAAHDLRSRQFIDLGVSGPSGERRVLVLLH